MQGAPHPIFGAPCIVIKVKMEKDREKEPLPTQRDVARRSRDRGNGTPARSTPQTPYGAGSPCTGEPSFFHAFMIHCSIARGL